MSEKLRHGHDPQIISECFAGAFKGHSTTWDGIKLAHNLSPTHCLYFGPEPQSCLPSSVSLSLSRSSSQKTTSVWKTWPGIGSTSSVRAVSSCWVAVHTLSPRASSCAPLVASPNAPEGLPPPHCQSPLDPTRRLKPSVLWGEYKSQQAVHILGWVVVDPWGSIVLKPEGF